jgi:hypothetical protein
MFSLVLTNTVLWDVSYVVSSVIVRNVSEEPVVSIFRVEYMGKPPTPEEETGRFL